MRDLPSNPGLQLVPRHASAPAPLAGRRIVVTRAAAQAPPLLERLAALGAEAISLPTIAIAPPADTGLLDLALTHLDHYSGFIFASSNAVRALFARARSLGVAAARPPGSWVCAVGPATAAALEGEIGAAWRADIVPAAYRAEGILAALAGRELRDQRILLPRANVARDLIPAALARRGAMVMAVECYRTVVPVDSGPRAAALFAAGAPPVDAVLFSSPSTARNLAGLLGPRYRDRLRDPLLVAIGPVTGTALAALGLGVGLEAGAATEAALAEALVQYWKPK